jgi:hypothetical protein
MAKLSTKSRNKLPKSKFALVSQRKYPIEDRAHAKNAKSRASQQFNKGNLSESQKDLVFRKADKVLKKGKRK